MRKLGGEKEKNVSKLFPFHCMLFVFVSFSHYVRINGVAIGGKQNVLLVMAAVAIMTVKIVNMIGDQRA